MPNDPKAKTKDTVDFQQVFEAELAAINFRRKKLGGRAGAMFVVDRKTARPAEQQSPGENIQLTTDSDLTGLALSGGGMRSASFSLGVLQALDALAETGKPQVIDALDYLSTVSGGGYIGTSLTAGLSDDDHHSFPFTSRLDSEETPEIQHLRDFSNFLAPNGFIDLVVGFATVVRGLVVNALTALPFLLFLAIITILSNPSKQSLGEPDILSIPITHLPHISIPGFEAFSVTINLTAFIVLAMFVSAIVVSVFGKAIDLKKREVVGLWMGRALLAIGVVAVFEVQPFVLAGMFGIQPTAVDTSGLNEASGYLNDQNGVITAFFGFFGQIAPGLSAVLAPVAVGLVTWGQKLANIATATAESKFSALFAKYTSVATLVLAGAVVPLMLWTAYIYLSYWGIQDNDVVGGCQTHAPGFFAYLVGCQGDWGPTAVGLIGRTYIVALGILLVLCLLIGPNANSLHYLYRDRLSRAFLLNREALNTGKGGRHSETDVDTEKFSSLKPVKAGTPQAGPYTAESFTERSQYAPYMLVNAAINLEGSEKLNRRGRNADTFLFSPLFIGNHFTGYIPTRRLEDVEPEFGLASAMAISGAAASANMGRATIRPLTFSLALLNIRLGFWFPNPDRIAEFANPLSKRIARAGIWQFFLEAFSKLSERSLNVYLTDGGHVENLGVYELVRRRCRVIIAVDSDLDPALTFPSLVGLEMMARIDLGARIEAPWQDLQAVGIAVTDTTLHGADNQTYVQGRGPHVAVGIIRYDNDETGVLIHIKSMLTGDENDYILDYKRRNSTFPHETTLDQFFSEEQFEVYRALGFHAAWQFFTGAENFGHQIRNAPDDWLEQVGHALKLLNVPDAAVDKIVARMKAEEDAAAALDPAAGAVPADPVAPVVDGAPPEPPAPAAKGRARAKHKPANGGSDPATT